MKIRKFTGATEQDAIEKIRDEMGLDALVINIKKIQPKGIFAFMRKSYVEVTAAHDERARQPAKTVAQMQPQPPPPAQTPEPAENSGFAQVAQVAQLSAQVNEKDERIRMLSDMLHTTGDALSRAQSQLSVAKASNYVDKNRIYQNNMLQIFYDTLVDNLVDPIIAQEILDDLDGDEQIDIDLIVAVVYNSLVGIIGEPQGLATRPARGNPQKFAFVGPTGVGKTTTIAKLTADLALNRGMGVSLITADTYRIAAVEQLKTYGDILGIDVAVAYKPDDLTRHVRDNKDTCDIVLIDTAGRSHKHREHLGELSQFLDAVADLQVFLVLSLTTKYEDMLDIIETFDRICDFEIIFTKMDETGKLGSIVNVCHKTGKKLSYITFGQNVPDDIKTIAPGEVAMRLLGLGEEDF
ncbi:MAG: flagellar biosynthesis protein FlhF [Defluviitaleaceae bacterium]|nr:flagellar biosynthesis protein FlhF [Defluviitaleaceae bacterium]